MMIPLAAHGALYGLAIGFLAAALVACTSSVNAAEPLDLERLHKVNCQVESRTFRHPDIAVSPAGAVGYCQVLPETAAWVVRHAVAWGLLPDDYMIFYREPKAWKWLLKFRYVNEAISRAYLRWLIAHRSRDARVVLYKYHAGQNAQVRRGTESWQHSAEVLALLYPWTVPPTAARAKNLTVR